MADEKVLNVSVVSAEKALWTGQAKSLVAKTPEGDIGILPNHEPVLALLVELVTATLVELVFKHLFLELLLTMLVVAVAVMMELLTELVVLVVEALAVAVAVAVLLLLALMLQVEQVVTVVTALHHLFLAHL